MNKEQNAQSPIVRKIEQIIANTFTRVVIYLTDGFIIAGAALLVPIFAIYVGSIGGGIIEAGFAYSIFFLTAGIGILILSRIEDSLGDYPKFLNIGYALACLAYLLYIFANSPYQLYFAQFILGIAAAVRVPAYDVLLTKHSSQHLAVAWGNWNATAYLVSAFSAIFGAVIASTFGFKAMLVLIFILSVISYLLSLLLVRSGNEISPSLDSKPLK